MGIPQETLGSKYLLQNWVALVERIFANRVFFTDQLLGILIGCKERGSGATWWK